MAARQTPTWDGECTRTCTEPKRSRAAVQPPKMVLGRPASARVAPSWPDSEVCSSPPEDQGIVRTRAVPPGYHVKITERFGIRP